jgi:hypothetical protein
MKWTLALVLSLAACNADDSASDTDAVGDTDGGGDTDTDTDVEPTCDAMTAGEDWAWRGECPQMLTPCEIEVDGCTISIAYSSGMTMGMPDGGEIEGNEITFTGGSYDNCVGTLEDADTISGSCDGCTFTLTR